MKSVVRKIFWNWQVSVVKRKCRSLQTMQDTIDSLKYDGVELGRF